MITRSTTTKEQGHVAYIVAALAVLILIILTGVIVVAHRHPSVPKQVVRATNSCISKSLQLGSTGNCVADAQTMIDFMQTDKLTQCPFTGASILPINSTYDAPTKAQATIIQNWFNCYDKEEGTNPTITANGLIGPDTWSKLCSFAYTFPKQSASDTSPYASQTLTAGKDAGCGS